jgi:hypothetical protein
MSIWKETRTADGVVVSKARSRQSLHDIGKDTQQT